MNTPGRNNGLPASLYTPLVDLEPQLADALLEALRDEGVAAYAAPSPGVKGPYQDVALPGRPTDRVWVDAGERTRAREVLSARMPEFHDALADDGHAPLPAAPPAPPITPSPDEDAAWEAIIAGWDLTANDPIPRWPVSEDVEPRDARAPEPGPQSTVIRPAQTEPPPLGPRSYSPPEVDDGAGDKEDPEDHYVPPPPPPLPRIDPLTKLAWVGVLALPIWMIAVHVFDWVPIEGSNVLAFAAFFAGAGGLIYRMKDDLGQDDKPDDGAIV